MRRASAIKMLVVASVRGGGGGAVVGIAVAASGMAGAGGRIGRPQGVELALLPWRRAWAWAPVWQQAEVVVRD